MIDKLISNWIVSKFRDNRMTALIIVALAAVLGLGSVYVMHEPEDNVVEEISERVIESELGLPQNSIDLSPAKKK